MILREAMLASRMGAHGRRGSLIACLVLMLMAAPAFAIDLVPVLSGLASPLFVTHAGDGSRRLFIEEQAGTVRVLQPGAAASTLFLDIRSRVLAGGERGL